MNIRPPAESDVGFIVENWLRSYRDQARYHDLIPDPVYWAEDGHRGTVLRALAECSSLVASDGDRLVGFVCGEGHTLHYVFVRPERRRSGIARQLMEAAGLARDVLVCTHATSFIRRLSPRWAKTVIFNPYRKGQQWQS